MSTPAAGADERTRDLLADEAARRTVAGGGYLDLLDGDLDSTGRTQDLMLTRLVPAIYERWWRPALGRFAKGVTGPGMEEEVRIARLLLGLGEGERVLDVGCGPGNFSRRFARAVGPDGLVVGLDASATMLARGAQDVAREGPGNVALVRASAVPLPFRDATFDATCCFAALHLFADPEAALDEMRRVLGPGGRVALMTSVRRGALPPPLKPLFERASGIRLFEGSEMTAALERRGFVGIHRRLAGMVQFVGGRLPTPGY